MKKKVLLFTAICLLFTVTFGSSNLVSAATDVTKTTNVTVATDTAKTTDIPVVTDTTKATDATEIAPSVGDKISGFKITQIKYDSSTESTQILFQHVKTGARLLVIKNKDINRGFSIKFNTPADNDKGINHIIEHSVLGGSTKYPSSNIIFDVSNTTFISYANAFTYQNMTMYPICSESEVQLLKSADIYLDAVYHPLLLSDQKIFEREGWRYEIADESSALTYNGIVYNEMQGSMGSIESASSANAQKAIFPSSNQGNNSGGDPDSIKTLTYKELIKTYKANYHPSNSLMVLYGDVDYEAFLKMIDENYLSSYSKKTISIDRDTQKAFTKLKEKNYTFPVAVGTDTVNKSVIDLVFATSDIQKLGAFNYVGLSTAVSLLNLDNSHIKQALLASGIAESYSIAIDPTSYQPTIHFVASNADPDKKDAFYKLVMLELKKVVRNGLDTELIKSSLRSLEFAEALGSDSSTAVNQLATVSLYDNLFGDPLMDYNSYYKAIVSKLDENVLENIIDKQLIQNKFAALTVTVPKAGLSEKNQAALTKELSKEKASLSKKELKALIKKVTAFNAWNGQKTSDEVLKSLRAVTLSDIETDVKEREIKESTIDGVKLWTAKADISDISSIYLSFDLSHLTKEELLYLHFYSDMVNNGMATVTRTENQVLNDVVSKAYTVATGLSAISDNKNDTSAHPTFNVNYYGFETEYADTFDLVSDMIFESNTADITTYGTRTLANIKADYEYQFSEPLNIALYRSMAVTSSVGRYYNYFTGLDYYNFILSVEKEIASNPTNLTEKINAIRTKAFNKQNLTILFAGNTSAQDKFASSMKDFTSKLPDKTYAKAEYSLPIPSSREALAINSTVAYVVVNGSLLENNVPISGKSDIILSLLNNLMLTPEIRLKGGAYGVAAFASDNTYLTYTYRDSNFINSLATIGATDEFLKTVAPYVTEDTLESYKLSAYAAASQSTSEINEALIVLSNKLQGNTLQDKIDKLNQIKDTSVDDILVYAKYLENINNHLNYVIAAPMSDIEKNKDMFDSIIVLP